VATAVGVSCAASVAVGEAAVGEAAMGEDVGTPGVTGSVVGAAQPPVSSRPATVAARMRSFIDTGAYARQAPGAAHPVAVSIPGDE
jgi:hypothetical protein